MPVPFNDLRRAYAVQQAALEAAAVDVLRSGWMVLGKHVENCENTFAKWCGVGHCVGMGNGSEALELALRAVGVEPGQRVICVANAGFYATGAILAIGAEPHFVDIESERLLIDVEAARAALETQPAAIIVTHLYGRLADIEPIREHAEHRGVALIEDCAQDHGACREGRRAGSFGDIGCFSFYPTKNLGALGDAGACVTSDPKLAARLLALRQYGWSRKYQIDMKYGRNSRLDELQAALLSVRLSMLDANNQRRQEIARQYSSRIIHPLIRAPEPGDDDVAHLYVLRCSRRDALANHLRSHAIGCEIHYPIADHRQPAWANELGSAVLPTTEAAAGEVLSLPCFPELTDAEVDTVVAVINQFEAAAALS